MTEEDKKYFDDQFDRIYKRFNHSMPVEFDPKEKAYWDRQLECLQIDFKQKFEIVVKKTDGLIQDIFDQENRIKSQLYRFFSKFETNLKQKIGENTLVSDAVVNKFKKLKSKMPKGLFK